VLAAICGGVAWRKQRNVPLWVLLGFGSGLLALGVVALLPGPARQRSSLGAAVLLRAAEHLAARAS
jgi:hypothetical protein